MKGTNNLNPVLDLTNAAGTDYGHDLFLKAQEEAQLEADKKEADLKGISLEDLKKLKTDISNTSEIEVVLFDEENPGLKR